MACNGVDQSSAVGFPGSERSSDAELPVVRLDCCMIRFNYCLWALQDVRELEPQIGPGVKAGAWRRVRPQSA
jgi:hypothetical protein